MTKSRLQIATPQIAQSFQNERGNIFKHKEIATMFANNRDAWNLTKSTSLTKFITFLTDNDLLAKYIFSFPFRSETRYVWGEISLLEVLLSLKDKSYFCHLTALHLHGLSTHEPNLIYFNFEQADRPQSPSLEQRNIDAAFRNKARQTNNWIEHKGKKIFMLNGKNTDHLCVVEQTVVHEGIEAEVKLTDIERTLIDITVRPVYAGGIEIVQRAYELAKDRVSIPKLIATLNKLKYLYPFHQAIGYYLEQAGYDENSIKLIDQMPKEYDFYLCNQIKKPTYIKKWRLYVPS